MESVLCYMMLLRLFLLLLYFFYSCSWSIGFSDPFIKRGCVKPHRVTKMGCGLRLKTVLKVKLESTCCNTHSISLSVALWSGLIAGMTFVFNQISVCCIGSTCSITSDTFLTHFCVFRATIVSKLAYNQTNDTKVSSKCTILIQQIETSWKAFDYSSFLCV